MLILYTAHLHGDLPYLPRLATFLQQVQQERGQALLLDLGGACSPAVWHCAATDGRSALVVLDGMGYHAANVDGMSAANRHKLQGVTSMGLVDVQHAWRYQVPPVSDDTIIVGTVPVPALRLSIVLQPHAETRLQDKILTLQSVHKGAVGAVTLDLAQTEPRLIQHEILTVPTHLRPDIAIQAAVEFVLEEAQRYQAPPNQ